MKARHVIAIFFFLGIFGYINGYYDGKRAADRWYAKHQPVATTQQIVTCSGVTLIDRVLCSAPAAASFTLRISISTGNHLQNA